MIQKSEDMDILLANIGNGKTSGFVIVQFYEMMNYYSPDKPGSMIDHG